MSGRTLGDRMVSLGAALDAVRNGEDAPVTALVAELMTDAVNRALSDAADEVRERMCPMFGCTHFSCGAFLDAARIIRARLT